MEGPVSAFLDHLKTERRASEHTIRSYEHDLELYCALICGKRRVRELIQRPPIRSGCAAMPRG